MSNIRFSQNVLHLNQNIVDWVFMTAHKVPDTIFLAGGTPPFPIKNIYWEKLITHAKSNPKIAQYPYDVQGDISLRKKIALDLSEEFQIKVNEHEILLTVGSSAALYAIFQAFLNKEDEVLWLSPGFPGNIPQIILVGGKLIEIPLSEKDQWQIDFEILEKSISKKTKLLVYSEPSNPTGAVFSQKDKKKLFQIANKHNFLIIADETYRCLVYPGTSFQSICASFRKNATDSIILTRSFSKDFLMSGLRLGFVYADQEIIEKLKSIHIAMNMSAPSISQEMAKIIFDHKKDIVVDYMKQYLQRRDLMFYRLDKLKTIFSYIKPKGSYYIFLKYNKKMSSLDYFRLLLEKAKVVVMPGIAFGMSGENHIRVSFTNTLENINIAFDRIESVLKEL